MKILDIVKNMPLQYNKYEKGETSMKISPLFDRIVVKEEIEKQTNSGIFLGNKDVDGPKIGTVVKVPKETQTPDGKDFKLYVKEGDKVLFNKYAGVESTVNGKTVIFIRQTDILAVID